MSSLRSRVDGLGEYFKHPVVCLDPTLLAAPNTKDANSVREITAQHEKQKQQIISSYERQVQRLLSQLSVAWKQIEFLETYRSNQNQFTYYYKQHSNNSSTNTNGNRLIASGNKTQNNNHRNGYITNNNSDTTHGNTSDSDSNRATKTCKVVGSNGIAPNINEILSNTEAYIDQMQRKMQFMNEEMVNMRNLYKIKIDIISKEFATRNEIQTQEIESLKRKLSQKGNGYQKPNKNDKKRDSIDDDDNADGNLASNAMKMRAMPSFQLAPSTMTPSPPSSEDDTDGEDQDDAKQGLALSALQSHQNFQNWTSRPQFAQKPGVSAMTPSPPGSPNTLMERQKAKKNKQKSRHKKKHSARMASIPELDKERQREIEKQLEKETLRMARKLGTFGDDDDDSSSSTSGSDVGTAREELIGHISFAVTVSNGNMTPSPTREAAFGGFDS